MADLLGLKDQMGHTLMIALVVALLAVTGVQLRMLRRTPRQDRRYLMWRAAAYAQAACWLTLLALSVVQIMSPHS